MLLTQFEIAGKYIT